MNLTPLDNHPGWQWCTAEGAELDSLLIGLKTSMVEKIQWLEEAENLTIAMAAGRKKLLDAKADQEPGNGSRPG